MADAKVLPGKPVARALLEVTLERAERFTQKKKRLPKLAVLTSEDPSALSYLKSIRSTASKAGVALDEFPMKTSATTSSVVNGISQLNRANDVDGILIQTPVPENIDFRALAKALNPDKDVDGITPTQAGILFHGVKGAFAPSTARACIEILDYYKIALQGAEVVVLGRSIIVGRPVALLALSRNATVTWCHTKTAALPTVCRRAEILIAAVGKPNLVNVSFVRAGATVIDVGINVDENGKLTGDVDVPSISNIAAAYTPVPGGVGPVTVSCLFANVLDAAEGLKAE
jgi:methylenetetrahydrofolate dehydrogenase (NADP+) / methenyltetrahydrofolate cyclohydrolase